MNEVEKLKLVKVPLWARLLGSIRRRLELRARLAEKRYITTVFHWRWFIDRGHWMHMWWVCFEDGYGRRTYEFGSDNLLSKAEAGGKMSTTYATAIRPWMAGHWSNEALREYADRTRAQPVRKAG